MYAPGFRNKRRFIGGAEENGTASAREDQQADYLYYNAVINGADSNRFSLAPAQAFYSEVRSIPLLPDTTGWNMAVSRLATVGATDNFPLLIPKYTNPATYESIYNIGATVRIAGETTVTPGTVISAYNEFALTNNPFNSLGFWGDASNPTSYLGIAGTSQFNFFLGGPGQLFSTVNSDDDNAVRIALQLTPLGWMNSLNDVQTMINNACDAWNGAPANANWRINMTVQPIINASGATNTFRFLISSPADNNNYLPNRPDWNPARIISPAGLGFSQLIQGFLAVRCGNSGAQIAGSWAGIDAIHFIGTGTTFESAVFTNTAGAYGGLNALQYASLPGMVGNQTAINQWRYTQIGNAFAVPANIQAGSGATFQWTFQFAGFGSYVPSAFEFVVVYLPPNITDITQGQVVGQRVIDVETATSGPYPTTYNSITTGPFANPYTSVTALNLYPGGNFVAAVRLAGNVPSNVPSNYYIQGPFGVNMTNFTYTAVTGLINTVFSSQRPIVFNPQNTGHPTWITSYDYFANQINRTLKLIADDISSQLISTYGLRGSASYGLRNNPPTLSYDSNSGLFSLNTWPNQYGGVTGTPNYIDPTGQGSVFQFSNGSFVPIPAPLQNVGPLNLAYYNERWSISMNTALAQLLPFPVTNNKDNDSSYIDASAMQIAWTGATLSLDVINNALKLQLTQEYVSTAAWNPFVGLAITTNSIPAQFETSGQTIVSSGQAPVAQVGNTTNPTLFDLDFSTTNAHSLLQGISFSPTIYRWVQMSGGPLSDIGFFVYLKTRDNTLVPWDVPAFGMIDIKFLFSHSPLGITA